MERMSFAVGEHVLPVKGDHADLDLGPFVHGKNQLHGVGGGNFLVGRLDHRELVPVLGLRSLITTSAFLILVGSNWLSTASPTLRSLNASRMSDSLTDLSPWYSILRITGRSTT